MFLQVKSNVRTLSFPIKHERMHTTNYRSISIASTISKIYEKFLLLSRLQCGFRKGLSRQHYINVTIGKSYRSRGSTGALLTDLNKTFYCIEHVLLIAKLENYAFDNNSLQV